ncbi:MAG TPA: L,D-transpeptidase family protein [Acidimicrobiia bacterium]|nr:L,D-transpeptidase family protein [Acidimicrobiia bacterium]
MTRLALRSIVVVATALLLGSSLVPAASAALPLGPSGSHLVDVRTGDEGEHVAGLQAMLRRLKMYRGEIDGRYGLETQVAVMTFHKYFGLERAWEFDARDWWQALEMSDDHGIPHRADEPDRVEVDIGRQLLFIVRDHEVTDIAAISSGGSYTYWSERNQAYVRAGTPRGDFTLTWFRDGYQCDSVTGWCVYDYWAFHEFYGIHGYYSVPAWPASHGCVRLNTWEVDALQAKFELGMPVHIWDVMPVIDTSIPERAFELA